MFLKLRRKLLYWFGGTLGDAADPYAVVRNNLIDKPELPDYSAGLWRQLMEFSNPTVQEAFLINASPEFVYEWIKEKAGEPIEYYHDDPFPDGLIRKLKNRNEPLARPHFQKRDEHKLILH